MGMGRASSRQGDRSVGEDGEYLVSGKLFWCPGIR